MNCTLVDGTHTSIKVKLALTSNDSAIIRQWTLDCSGIAYKSIRDVQRDLDTGWLQTMFDDYAIEFQDGDDETRGLHFVYPSRHYVPRHVLGFIDFLKNLNQKHSRRIFKKRKNVLGDHENIYGTLFVTTYIRLFALAEVTLEFASSLCP